MAGLAGLGDLVLTCTGGFPATAAWASNSAADASCREIIAGMHGVVAEGIFTTTAAVGLARSRGVEMPITEQMHAILTRAKLARDAIHELMTRSGKSETATRTARQEVS